MATEELSRNATRRRWPGRPRTRASLLARPRLFELLDEGLDAGAILVEAGPGYGKTTLVSSWLDRLGVSVRAAWLTMRREDDDRVALVNHLHDALADAGLLPRNDSREYSLADLVTAAASRSSTRRPLVLVLDDVHVATRPDVLSAISALGHAVPEKVCLVLVGREDLPLGWGVLRARGTVVEIREDDLVLDADETQALLAVSFRVSATHVEAAEIVRVTEGWAVGVCLAGLAMSRARDPADQVRTWATAARHDASAFLDESVLAGRPDDLRRFLEDTSVLPVLLPALCDAATGRQDSRDVLRQLASARLFTEALEGDEESYRYHPLFAEALQERLDHRDPVRRAVVLTRAARWLEDHDRLLDAANLLVEGAGPQDHIEALVRRAGGPAIAQGQAATVVRWLRSMPLGRVASEPVLALLMARASGITGDVVTARAMLHAVEDHLHQAHAPAHPGLRLGVTHLQVALAIWEGHLDGIVEPLRAEAQAFGDDSSQEVLVALGLTRAAVLSLVAAAQLFQGQFDAAQHTASEAVVPGEMVPVTRNLVMALGVRALALAWSGEEAAARRAVDEALPSAKTMPDLPESLFTWTAVAWVGSHEQMQDHHAHLARSANATAVPLLRCLPALAEVRRQTRLNHPERAREAFVIARKAVSEVPEPGYLRALLVDLDQDVDERARQRPDLTERELELISLLETGASRREMGELTHYSVDTVKYHLKSAYRKLGVGTREAAISRAREWGLLEPPASAAVRRGPQPWRTEEVDPNTAPDPVDPTTRRPVGWDHPG